MRSTRNRVEGEFASTDEDSVIPFEWVEAATERWQVWKDSGEKPGLTVVGVDVARSGADKTVLALRAGDVVTELRTFHHEDTMVTSGRVAGVLQANPGAKAVVDVLNMGAGVVDDCESRASPARSPSMPAPGRRGRTAAGSSAS